MEENIITKETIQKLMAVKGEVRGVVFKTDGEYVLKEKGEEGLRKLEEELKKLGTPIKYKEIKTMAFYPVGLRIISILAIKKVFDFDNERIKDMGLFATKISLIIKLFIRYFLSIQRVFFKEAPKIWKKHWTIGEMVPIELNEDQKYAILKIKDFNLHPIYCYYLRGYLSGILKMLVKTSKVISQETKCSFQEGKDHEYLLKWE
ncbi:MAG: hypothetical protein KJI71_03540 [Patescibacteria group bacterium]|nr:hypothetical protein [Patescibacteria group bacterium]